MVCVVSWPSCCASLFINAEFIMFSGNHSYQGCFLCQFKREEFPLWCKGQEGGKRFFLISEALDS